MAGRRLVITARSAREGSDARVATLGDLLYADHAKTRVAESEWAELVQSIACGDPFALRALYEATRRLVFTLLVRITHDRATAEELTFHVYHRIWQRASTYDPACRTVVGWVMNQARRRALYRLRREKRAKRADRSAEDPLARHSAQPLFLRQSFALQRALAALGADERHAIESVFLSESTYAEVAAASNQPADRVRTHIASGMAKLRRALGGDTKPSSSEANGNATCAHNESVFLYAVRALAPGEMFLVGAHVAACEECKRALETLDRVTDTFVCWPTDLLRPWDDPWARLARRISEESCL
jgi:RNA polymerase sigma-70 factor (ECF subfamily)